MVITKEYLVGLKNSLEQQLRQLTADANAAKGALQLIEHQIVDLEKEVEQKV